MRGSSLARKGIVERKQHVSTERDHNRLATDRQHRLLRLLGTRWQVETKLQFSTWRRSSDCSHGFAEVCEHDDAV